MIATEVPALSESSGNSQFLGCFLSRCTMWKQGIHVIYLRLVLPQGGKSFRGSVLLAFPCESESDTCHHFSSLHLPPHPSSISFWFPWSRKVSPLAMSEACTTSHCRIINNQSSCNDLYYSLLITSKKNNNNKIIHNSLQLISPTMVTSQSNHAQNCLPLYPDRRTWIIHLTYAYLLVPDFVSDTKKYHHHLSN